MKITLTLPDDLAAKYQAQAEKAGRDLAVEILLRLATFANEVVTDTRFILVQNDERHALEAIFQIPIDDGKDLLARVKLLNTVKLGECERQFTAGELSTLHEQAAFHGYSTVDYIKLVADKVFDELFNR